MTDFDVVVIGGGTGNSVAAAAAEAGEETALVEPGPLGGTCLNRGCNPSKMLIQRATVAETIRDADRFGIDASIDRIDFAGFVDEVESTLSGIAEEMADRYREMDGLTLYRQEATFVDERTLAVGDETITGDRIVVAVGSRPVVPPIDGLDDVEYLTSDDALYLDVRPACLVIVGGGYIAAELGYFFEAMGTDVRIVQSHGTLLPREDPAVAETFTEIAEDRHEVYTGYRGTAVSTANGDGEGVLVTATSADGDEVDVAGDRLLLAVGRRPNGDTLDLDATGIETDDRGFVETNDYLETTAENVWAMGDVAGNFLFKHSGDYEARHAIDNVVHGERRPVDFTAVPHAVFAEPQIGGVGATEAELDADGRDYVVGKAAYADTAMGRAKKLEEGFSKVLAAPDGRLLGCHVIGHEASTLVHEAVVAMRSGEGRVEDVADAIHAHPTLNKVMEAAFRDVPV
jgi:dihydrolipoamide dehydrogenase